MATIEDSLRAYLVAQSSITDLVSTKVRTGLEPQESQLPAITIRVLDDPVEYHMAGMISWSRATIACQCHSTSRTEARDIAEKIRLLFVTPTIASFGSHSNVCVFYSSTRDEPPVALRGSEQPIFTSSALLEINYYQDMS